MSSNRSFHSAIALCRNIKNQTESELQQQLKAILTADPAVTQETDEWGFQLIHLAARNRSPEFCELLVDANIDLVRNVDTSGWLPIHYACLNSDFDTLKYLLRLYPESIHIPNGVGAYPMSMLLDCRCKDKPRLLEMTRFLLKQHHLVLATRDHNGDQPLHLACRYYCTLPIVKLLFDSYPEAIYNKNLNNETPLDIALVHNRFDTVHFLDVQRKCVLVSTDENGKVPIHRVLLNRCVSAGAVSLILKAHPSSITAFDREGNLPLHIACQVSDLDIVQILVETNRESLNVHNANKDLPLHVASRQGNCDGINYLLEQSTYGVTRENIDMKLPIELLVYDSGCDRNELDYVNVFFGLFQSNPVEMLACLHGVKNVHDTKRKGNETI